MSKSAMNASQLSDIILKMKLMPADAMRARQLSVAGDLIGNTVGAVIDLMTEAYLILAGKPRQV
jgi:hypothetical protein